MAILILYFIVVLAANIIGALSGMGSGVIIKPALDAVGAHDLVSINFYSSVSVFVMSVVSIIKQVRDGFEMNISRTITIAAGSIVGGTIGNVLFARLLVMLNDQDSVLLFQIILTVISLVLVLIYLRFNIKSYELKSLVWVFSVGAFLGFLSTLLGIGGGPINVAMFMFAFSMPLKQATVYSIAAIFFSQLSKLVTIGVGEGFGMYELDVLWAIIPASIIGGFLGSILNQKLSELQVNLFYRVVTLGVILLNLFNAAALLMN